ncbi:MAG: chorismate synthase [Clostridia bacterium]|nr:chorismate synthase [Clostridia bacterium]
MYQTGDKFKVTVFGQSHSAEIGATIEGLPAGFCPDMEKVYAFMERRAPGRDRFSTQRKEPDIPEIISGLENGVTTGEPLTAVIKNSNQRSSDYDNLKFVPRPGHADYTAYVKYDGKNDMSGGGQFSGRMTAPICIAGALAIQILEEKGIHIGAHIETIHNVKDDRFIPYEITKGALYEIKEKEFPVINDFVRIKMEAEIDRARENGDSVGGVIECAVVGMPIGVGGPLFDGIEGGMSRNVFAVPGVKGIEFGAGFSVGRMLGSENNDEFYYAGDNVKTKTNNAGGILGGISNGMPIVFRVAMKPTPSISKEQNSVNLKTMENEKLVIKGRHDPCIVKRAVPVIEAVAAITILNMIEN